MHTTWCIVDCVGCIRHRCGNRYHITVDNAPVGRCRYQRGCIATINIIPISSADCLMAISIISRFVICFSPFYQFSNLGMRRHVHFGNSVYHSLHPATQSFRFFSFRRSSARYLQNMKQHSRCPLHCCRINGGIIHDIRIFLLCRLRCVCVIAGERL